MTAKQLSKIDFISVSYPEPEIPPELPGLPKAEYDGRLEKVRQRMEREKISHLVVYGDREHFANIRFLTGYDPRFEETLLMITKGQKPILLVGNEGLGYSKIVRPDVDIVLFQHFSLQGQPRQQSKKLIDIFRQAGLTKDSMVGVVGNKYAVSDEFGEPRFAIDAPAYIVDLLRQLCGGERVFDVTSWFTHPEHGFRMSLTVDEIALYEMAGQWVYAGVKNSLESLHPGMTELEMASKLGYNGFMPLSCHICVGFGENAELGLASPTSRRLNPGDFISMGFGVWGANIARSGIALAGPDELPSSISDAVDKVYKPYYQALYSWYQTLKVGLTGGELYDSARELAEDPFYGVTLNLGHQIREEEWINSPIASGSGMRIPAQSMLQSDIIVSATAPYSGIHSEDGVVLADSVTRQQLAVRYPDTWRRMMRRRRMMSEQLGYILHEDVLPMSDMAGLVTPFLLNPHLALAFVK